MVPPTIYQGTEIGMTNVAFDSLDDYKDVETLNTARMYKEQGRDLDELLKAVHKQGRDNVRTPMQWDGSDNAGFTEGEPWIKLNPNYESINAEKVLADPNSIFYFYQKMLKIRKANPTLIYGDYEPINADSEQIFAYKRWDADGAFYVFLNFTEETQTISLPANADLELLIGNYENADSGDGNLAPWEARLYRQKV